MTATFIHRLRRAIRELRAELQPGRQHHIDAARRSRITRRAHDCQDAHRNHFRKAAR